MREDLNKKEIIETFYEIELQKTIEKLIFQS